MADLMTNAMTIAYPEREMRMLSIVPLADHQKVEKITQEVVYFERSKHNNANKVHILQQL